MKVIKLLPILAMTAPGLLFAQETDSDEEEVFALSPFVVDSSKDSGYLASQTLSGTRLATDLRDAPSPVTVLTTEYLEDIDATDINSALKFVPSVDDDPRGYNSLNNNPVSTRIRGFENTQNNVNFFQTRVSIDRYNIDRIEINRGPNAILFGIGNPGGVFTATTISAQYDKNFGSVQNRLDTNESWRFTGDWNQVLIDDKFAVRVAAMTEDRKGFIRPMSDRDERFFITFSAKLVETDNYDLNVRYQYENVEQVTTVRDWNLSWDNLSDWQDAGSPTYDSADQVPPADRWPAGMDRVPNAFTVAVVTTGSNGDIPAFSYGNRPTSAQSETSLGERYRLGTQYSTAMIPGTDKRMPVDISYSGPSKGFSIDSISHNVFIEQNFFDKIFTEFAWWREETDRDWNRSTGGQNVNVDLLEVLPNGQPNPNFGQLFTQGFFRVQDQYREIETFRFTVGYELDLTDVSKWLGRHRFGLLLEQSRDLLGLNDYVDVNLETDFYANNLTAFGNRIVRRSYLFNGGGAFWQPQLGPGRDSYIPLSGTVDDASVRDAGPLQTGLANFRITRGETETDSWVFSMQSFFLNDRLIPFWGIRGDDQVGTQLESAAQAASRVNGVYPSWRTLPYEEASTFKDETLTWGIIGRITPNFDLFYNSSEVLSPGSSRPDYFGNPVQPSTGEGWDAGVRFDLLDGKLIGSISYYNSTQLNVPQFNELGGDDGSNLNSFLDSLIELENAGTVPDLDYESRMVTAVNTIDTYDNEAEGIEFNITYNPLPNWRISFRGAKAENKQSDVQSRSYAFLQQNIFPLESQLPGDLVLPNAGNIDNVAEFYSNLRDEIAREKFSREGVLAQRLAKWRMSLVTNYRFRDGPLKGWSVGGNVRYISKLHVQALLDDSGAFSGDYVFSKERYLVGLNIGYWKRISKRVNMSIRLNITNLFDDDDPAVHQVNATTGEIFGIRPFEGRSASLTTTFRF